MGAIQRDVFIAYYIDNATQEEISENFHIYRSRVNDIIKQIRKRFKDQGLPEPDHLTKGRVGRPTMSIQDVPSFRDE